MRWRWSWIAMLLLATAAHAEEPAMRDADHRLAPDDQVQLAVTGMLGSKRMDFKIYVDDDGALNLPMMRSPLHVAGMTTNEATKAIMEAYRRGDKHTAHVDTSVTLLKVAVPTTGPSGPPMAIGDLLRISIAELSAPNSPFTCDVHIDDDGNLPLPLLSPLHVAGLSADQIVKAARTAYHKKQLIARADITVSKVDQKVPISAGPFHGGDRIRIRMWDLEGPGVETASEVDLTDEGLATLPRVGAVNLLGKSEGQAADEIKRVYNQANLVQNMIVTVQRLATREGP
jgi:protein involved in polysaccharide export with SLBB domain